MNSQKSPLITCAVLSLMYFPVFSQNAFALRNYNNHPDLAKAMEFDPEMNGGDMKKADRSKAEFHYLRYLEDIQDPNESFQRARVYCQLGAMYAVSFNREKGKERDIDKAREFYKKVLENEPNRIDRPTLTARISLVGLENPESKMGRIKGRVEFYKWIASFDDNKIRKLLLPLTANPKDTNVHTTTQMIGIKNAIEAFKEVVISNSVDDALAMEVPDEGLLYIMDYLPADAPERKRVEEAIKRRKKTKNSNERIASTTDDKNLEQELNEVNKLRNNEKTPFEQAENMCNVLLEKYTEPEEQARIYYQLAVVYSQSGQKKPDKIIKFSKKALELPLDPIERLQLYVWWGDAIQIANSGVRGQDLVVARRKAVMPYLYGLKVSLSIQYPEYTQPEHLPKEQNVKADSRDPLGPFLRRRRAEQRKTLYESKQDRFEMSVNLHKKALTSQISDMYSCFPWASDEIRELATKILEDETAVDNLMTAVNEAVKKRAEELGRTTELPDNSPPKNSHGQDLSISSKATRLFEEEVQRAEKASERDVKIEHLRNALKHRPGHPDNLAAEFRIAVLLSQYYSPKNPQPVRRRDSVAVYENILRTYKHMDYYSKDPVISSSDMQFMIPQAAIHLACLYRGLDRDNNKARQWTHFAMECMQKTFEQRTKDWANEPAPPEVREDDPYGGRRERAKWKSRMHMWEQRQERVKEGDVFSPLEMGTVKAAVRQYGYSFGLRQKAGDVALTMGTIIRDFPGTPMAKIAEGHIERAKEMQ